MSTPFFANKWQSLLVIATAAGLAFGAGAAAAQSDSDDDAIEEIVVTGIRGSLQRSLEAKRNADQVIDSISAEDIGKFPDENVAESLQRVTGVQIDRSGRAFGEGSFISIRGLGPDTSRTFVNGRAVLATGFGERGVDFRNLPSEFVSSLSVVKSSAASDIDGSLSGHVDVTTAMPFDNGGGFRAAASAQFVYADLLDENLPRITGSISNTSADGTMGIMLTAHYEERDNRQDGFTTDGFDCVDATYNARCSGGQQFWRPRASRYELWVVPSERMGATAAVQWRPNDNFELKGDLLYNSRKEVSTQVSIVGLTRLGGGRTLDASTVQTSSSGTIIGASIVPGTSFANIFNLFLTTDAHVMLGGLNGTWTSGPWTFEGDLGYSESESGGDFDHTGIRHRGLVIGTDLASGVPSSMPLGDFVSSPTSTDGWQAWRVRRSKTSNEQDDTQYRFSASYDFADNDFIDDVEAGIRYADAEYFAGVFGARARSNFINFSLTPLDQHFTDPNSAVHTTAAHLGVSDYGDQMPGRQVGNFIFPNKDVLNREFLPAQHDFLPNAPDTALIGESTTALYVQMNFSNGPLSGNVGVRWVETEITADAEGVTPDPAATVRDAFTGQGYLLPQIHLENSYSDVLPSLNVRWEVRDDLIVRFGASKTLFRAEADELAPRGTVNPSQLTVRGGNAFLDPFRSTNINLALEYYFGDNSGVSATVFHMDIESFFSSGLTGEKAMVPGFPEEFDIVGPINGSGGKLRGLELGFQQAWDNGFGVVANLTLIDDDTENTNSFTGDRVGLERISESSYNLIGFYEANRISARLAYNYRDDFLQRTNGNGGLPRYVEGYGQLDGRIAYDLFENWQVSFEAKNITGEDVQSYLGIPERIRDYFNFGRRYFFGVRTTF